MSDGSFSNIFEASALSSHRGEATGQSEERTRRLIESVASARVDVLGEAASTRGDASPAHRAGKNRLSAWGPSIRGDTSV